MMLKIFIEFNPIIQSFLAGCFTFFITVLGSAVVFVFRKRNQTFMDSMLSLSAGIMLSAAIFSLLNPAIEMIKETKNQTSLTIIFGFLLGGILLWIGNKIIDSFSIKRKAINHNLKRSILLFSSITLHNIPEGLVIGVAFGRVPFSQYPIDSLLQAIALSIGIAIQNFPEGSAISLPLKRDKVSSIKAFLIGSISAIVEPIFAVIGTILILNIKRILPFVMSLAAGAMIYVVIQELIPETMKNKRKEFMSFLIMLGFTMMMILEIVLG